MPVLTLIRGGGDLASGVALRLHRAGLSLLITELARPLVVRRLVSFAEAVYAGQVEVEGARARLAQTFEEAVQFLEGGTIPVLVDPQAQVLRAARRASPEAAGPLIVVDARMTKRRPEFEFPAELLIGLGPGFVAGVNCHAAIETNRGHGLGRVLWQGSPEADTGIPEAVVERRSERVLRAPASGRLETFVEIGEHVSPGQEVAAVDGQPVLAPFQGVVRGLLHHGLNVTPGMKLGDVDPRDDPRLSRMVSDKALAIGGGVLEAILTRVDLRRQLWG